MLIREATPEDASEIARVKVDTWRTTYRGMIPDDVLDDLSYAEEAKSFTAFLRGEIVSKAFCVVAEEPGGGLVGFAAAGPERSGDSKYKGELYAVYILKEKQKRGIGRELFNAVRTKLEENGMDSMIVRVLRDNPSCKFYENMGGHILDTGMLKMGGTEVEEGYYCFSKKNV